MLAIFFLLLFINELSQCNLVTLTSNLVVLGLIVNTHIVTNECMCTGRNMFTGRRGGFQCDYCQC